MLDTNILVASKHAFGVHLSGLVMSRMSSQCGTVGRILNGLGNFPDLYRDRMRPILRYVSGQFSTFEIS